MKRENTNLVPFLAYLIGKQKPKTKFVELKTSSRKTPDYYIPSINALIEVKEIHDNAANNKYAQWGTIINKLQKATDKNVLLVKVTGTYLVNTPEVFKLHEYENTSTQIIQEIISGVNKQKIINVSGINFEINKVNELDSIIVYGSMGGAGFIDPANIVYQNTKDKISKANEQLSFNPKGKHPSKRILLLVNRYSFPLYDWDLFKSISLVYNDLITKCENIDEIWYQLETKDKGFVHKLLYRKEFFKQFEKSNFSHVQSEDFELFANWFSVLSEKGEEQKTKLLIALKYFLKNKMPYEIFPDNQTRIEMVRLGLWIAEKEMFKDLIWLIEKFITDSDPQIPEKYNGDKAFDYHQRLLKDDNVNIITTVLGHLAWDIQKLADRQEYIVKSFAFTKQLLSHSNLYVKLQASIPLIRIVAHKQWLEEYDKQNKTDLTGELHKIVFDLLKKYAQYKAFAGPLTHIFYYYKDLNTVDSLELVDNIKKIDEAAPLLIYFAVFRERHFKNPDGIDKKGFEPELLKNKLIDVIKSNNKNYMNIQGSIAWNFWKLLQDQPEEFDVIKPYIDLLSDKPYQKNCYHDLERIIEDWIERKPEVCIVWFEKLIKSLSNYIKDNGDKVREIWISPEKTITFIAQHYPKSLLSSISILVDLWKKGAFVGSPKEIFESYKTISNPELKNQAKKQIRTWYNQMKKINPKIQQTDFD